MGTRKAQLEFYFGAATTTMKVDILVIIMLVVLLE